MPLLFDTESELDSYVQQLDIPDEIKELGDEANHRFVEWCLQNDGPPTDEFGRNLATWYARKRACGANNTDRAFQQQQVSRYNGDEPWLKAARDKYRRATGKDVPSGAIYISQIAKEPNDPRAWVTDLGELSKRAREIGHGIDALGVKEEISQPKRVRYSPQLLQQHLRKAVADPSNIGKDVRELAHNITEKHAYDSKKLED